MALARLIYVSEPRLDPADGSALSQLSAILAVSRRNNEAVAITGALAFDESWFLQILEGERQAIWRTFVRINEDERHGDCALLEMVESPSRLFGNWWMGLAVRDAATAPIFEPFVVNGALRADEMSARDVIALMTALSKMGLDRHLLAAA